MSEEIISTEEAMSSDQPVDLSRDDKGRFKPGHSGNPKGKPAGGPEINGRINELICGKATEVDLRQIVFDKKEPIARRMAAVTLLKAIEYGDLADFEDVRNGKKTLRDLKTEGMSTDIVKKLKTKTREINREGQSPIIETEVEIELHDRSGENFDRIMDRTDGKAVQPIEVQFKAFLGIDEERI